MSFVRRICVEGLFGLYDHAIDLRSHPPVTIVAGPNGVGKTTLLGLTRSLLQGAYQEVVRHEFRSLSVLMESGAELSATPMGLADASEDGEEMLLRLELRVPRQQSREEILHIAAHPPDLVLPPYVERQGRDIYFDSRMGEYLSYEEAAARYSHARPRRRSSRAPTAATQAPEWFQAQDWRVDFIETKRLDTLLSRALTTRRREAGAAPIHVYLGNVRNALEDARRESALTRQARDRSFVSRILTRATATVNEALLRKRYSEVEALADELRANGLLSESLDVLPAGKLSPTNKRIVSLFLDDFEAKLKPLEPLSARLEQLRGIIGHKFLNKSIDVHPAKGIIFLAEPDGREIDPEALSSGEQHALALISRLLFTEEAGTTVLIDEPELSLHVSWQHEMVDDLIQIGSLVGVSFVLATHSTAIINGRWDLVEELGPLEAMATDE